MLARVAPPAACPDGRGLYLNLEKAAGATPLLRLLSLLTTVQTQQLTTVQTQQTKRSGGTELKPFLQFRD
jgi:hypothetical protein